MGTPRHPEQRARQLSAQPLGVTVNLDELADQIGATSGEAVVQRLSAILRGWKSDDTTAEELRETVERYIGNTWIASTSDHEHIYGLWSEFRDNAIAGIGGMTMNERLYWFGLFPRYEACETGESRLRIYEKLHASP